jgi:adenosylcobinamide kinase / adenosylcobinamide-phosphate guanylyltransferase
METHEEKALAAQFILLLGGARSGKSSFAERLAEQSGRSVAYIATAQASDTDMRQRIQRHQAARPSHWQTIEEPLHLASAVQQAASVADVLLLDCITTWLGNWLMAQGEQDLEESTLRSAHLYERVLAETDTFLASVAALPSTKTLLAVSNEVGLGIVPAYPLGRVYRDLLGLVNQRLATAAQRAYLLVAGIPVDLKRLQDEFHIAI